MVTHDSATAAWTLLSPSLSAILSPTVAISSPCCDAAAEIRGSPDSRRRWGSVGRRKRRRNPNARRLARLRPAVAAARVSETTSDHSHYWRRDEKEV